MWQKYRAIRFAALCFCTVLLCRAQLTTDQKMSDFNQMVAFYEYAYAPAAWKKLLFGFDLTDTAPWFARVQSSSDDLTFYEICYEYVASLNDSHSRYRMPSNWIAALGFTVDNYDAAPDYGTKPATGNILIDSIDRHQLPEAQFPFQIGDQLLSVDGVGVEGWIARLSKWTAASNSRSKRSAAALGIVERTQAGSPFQAPFPRAPLETGDFAVVQIRRQSGAIETYTISWQKSGMPVLNAPRVQAALAARPLTSRHLQASVQVAGSLAPGYPMPPGFQQRLGNPGDSLFSGVFPAAGKQIGYLRIPAFGPPQDPAAADPLAQLPPEIAYMQANTDGMVIDIMHNPGGAPQYVDAIYRYLSPQPYEVLHVVWKPNLWILSDAFSQLAIAEANHADPNTIAFYQSQYDQVNAAYLQGAALTPPFPLLGTTDFRDPATDDQGHILAYSKPLMLLTDEESVSAADSFAAEFQDNQRGIVAGIRTDGGGGNNVNGPAGTYSQGVTGVEMNLNVRNHIVNAPGYPPAPYFDNIGVRPNIVADLMTKENLLNGGASFSQAMVAAITSYLQQQSGH